MTFDYEKLGDANLFNLLVTKHLKPLKKWMTKNLSFAVILLIVLFS